MPSKLSQQIVAMVLSHVGMRSNTEDRHGAAVNVDALLSPANPASISDSARRAADALTSYIDPTFRLNRDWKTTVAAIIESALVAAAPADNDTESVLPKVITIVEATRNSSLWNCDGYSQALTDTIEKLNALTPTKGDR